MERNQAIGLVLITVIMMAYFMFMGNNQQQEPPKPQQREKTEEKKQTANKAADSSIVADSVLQQKFGGFSNAAKGENQSETLSNDLVQITFNSKGGAIEKVLLKKYFTFDKQPLYLLNKENSEMNFIIPSQNGDLNLKDLYFKSTKTDSSLIYVADLGSGRYIEQVYTLSKESYVVDYKLNFVGLDNLVKNDPVKFQWNLNIQKTERDAKQSIEKSTVNYYTDEDVEDLGISEEAKEEKVSTPIKWVALKQKFFSSAFITDNSFTNGELKSKVNTGDTVNLKLLSTKLSIATGDLKTGKGNFKFYFGPNQFAVLKDVPAPSFHKNVDLGFPGINFINRFIVIPVFHFLETYIFNYGVIIIILVILIKLLLFPLSYKSYISMAKMKVLKPEIDEIKARTGDDMQKTQMETMELYRKVGINPLSGCIPVLLQMPILLAMFNFFPNSIELRQQAFLWAPDLSTYDAPIMLPFEIPHFGNHISLFTLFMTISTILYTWFNNQVSTVTGPMKTVSYIMPIVFFFVLNSFPAGLSFYYFVSNLVTIGQQVVIRSFVKEDAIRQTLEDNKKRSSTTPPKKSRWMSRLEEAMKAQEEAKKKRKK